MQENCLEKSPDNKSREKILKNIKQYRIKNWNTPMKTRKKVQKNIPERLQIKVQKRHLWKREGKILESIKQ